MCCVAVLGVVFNLTAIGVLFRRFSAKNIFNQLITSLFLFDSIFLASQLINAFRWNFNLSTETHVLLFPYFLYPMTSISLTASIFMTVGIAHERYTAIRYPTQHRESMRSTTSRLMNMIKYIFLITIFAILFNIPKFLEAKINWIEDRSVTTIDILTR